MEDCDFNLSLESAQGVLLEIARGGEYPTGHSISPVARPLAVAALGLVVLQNDETLEPELRTIFNDCAGAIYHTRIASAEDVTPETLRAMERDLPRALALLPTVRPMDVVAYACTSGATLIGHDRVAEIISSVHPGCPNTNPITAVLAAGDHLGVRRLGLITPYVPDVSSAMRRLLEKNGLEITAFASFEQSQEAVVARISPQSVLEAICTVGRNEDVEAVFARVEENIGVEMPFADMAGVDGFDADAYTNHYYRGEKTLIRSAYARAMSKLLKRLKKSGAFAKLRKTPDFVVTRVGHDY